MDNYEKNGGVLGAVWGLYSGMLYVFSAYASYPPSHIAYDDYIRALTTNTIYALASLPAFIADTIVVLIVEPIIEYIFTLISVTLKILVGNDITTVLLLVIMVVLPLVLTISIGSVIGISIARLIKILKNKIVQ
ncbi:hypothetical protein [Methanolobus chelungpuianus]|uniref:Uncharacterized protein n=1 Tax=Methanolobus chelungpuianus TaxID=502115 RepID=A0AAE3H9U9_9EURY|nr:hypothetical protein [Methanolobus chelungpuianus]MCQ6962289.1 hypothetical protein [Methanolobus chelungpuianus]